MFSLEWLKGSGPKSAAKSREGESTYSPGSSPYAINASQFGADSVMKNLIAGRDEVINRSSEWMGIMRSKKELSFYREKYHDLQKKAAALELWLFISEVALSREDFCL